MQVLTDESQTKLAEIAARHGVSNAAAGQLLAAIAAGGGRQAQFNHPDLGGMGQWSQGGMIMIGDMFNQGLKARVAALCNDLAEARPVLESVASDPPHSWNQRWPTELGAPAATGSQNELHYAIFPGSRRLAIERDGQMTVYDTQDHQIGGVSQQQGSDPSLRFTSQSGTVRLSDLKIVGPAAEPPVCDAAPAEAAEPETPAQPAGSTGDDIFSHIERLADLHSRNIITAEEFATKKAELLARL